MPCASRIDLHASDHYQVSSVQTIKPGMMIRVLRTEPVVLAISFSRIAHISTTAQTELLFVSCRNVSGVAALD